MRNDRAEIVADVNLADDFKFAKVWRTGNERPAHAAFGSGDDDFGHSRNVGVQASACLSKLKLGLQLYFKIPHTFIVARNLARLAALIGTSGKRYSSAIKPIIASAALTGTGLVSMNKSLNSG